MKPPCNNFGADASAAAEIPGLDTFSTIGRTHAGITHASG